MRLGFLRLPIRTRHYSMTCPASAGHFLTGARPKKTMASKSIKTGRRGGEVSAALQAERVATRDAAIAPVIAEIRASGVTSAYGIAKALNERGIPTATGRAQWKANTVRRLLARITPACGAP
jgi:hypothetical protein